LLAVFRQRAEAGVLGANADEGWGGGVDDADRRLPGRGGVWRPMTIQRIVFDWAKVPAVSFATTFALLFLAIRGHKRVSRTAAILAPILLAVYANRTGWDTDVGMATVFCGLIPSALLMF